MVLPLKMFDLDLVLVTVRQVWYISPYYFRRFYGNEQASAQISFSALSFFQTMGHDRQNGAKFAKTTKVNEQCKIAKVSQKTSIVDISQGTQYTFVGQCH